MSEYGCSASEPLTALISSANTGGDGSGFQQSTAEKPDGGALGPRAAHRAAIVPAEPSALGGLRSSSDTNTTGSGTPDTVAAGEGEGVKEPLEHGVAVALDVVLLAAVAVELLHEEGDAVAHCDCDVEGLVERVGDADADAVVVDESDVVPHGDSDGDRDAETLSVGEAVVENVGDVVLHGDEDSVRVVEMLTVEDIVVVSVSVGDVELHGDCVGDTVVVTLSVGDLDAVSVSECDAEVHGDNVVDTVAEGDCDCVTDSVSEMESDSVGEPEKHSVAEPDHDTTDGDADRVDPAGAQNGPMLNVAR